MANRFWVGGSGTWDASDTTHWSASNGGAAGASAPTTSDNATINANSGAGTITFSGTPACSNFTASASSIGIFTGTGTLTIAGGTFTIKSGRTMTGWTGLVTLTNASPTITSAGNTFAFPLTITGTASTAASVTFADNLTISGNLTINGNSANLNRILVQSTTTGTSVTITANGTVTVTNADFQDITGAGSASWNIASASGGSGDCGGNSGITFTTPSTQHWLNASSSNWSVIANWTSRVPLPQDTAVMDKAFGTSQTVTINTPRISSVDWTGATWTTSLLWATSNAVLIFGSMTLISGLTMTSFNQNVTFSGRGSYILKSNGCSFSNNMFINSFSGTLTLSDDLNVPGGGGAFEVLTGTFTAGANNVTAKTILFGDSVNNYTVNMGSKTWTLTSTGGWSLFTAGGTINSQTSIIKFTDTSNTAITFTGGNFTYNNIWWSRGASTASNTILNSNTFNDFKDDGTAAHSILFSDGITTTFTTFTVTGNGAGNEISINGTSTGTHTLTAPSRNNASPVSVDYLNIQHSIAMQANTWYAGTHSINNQATATAGSGWVFTAPVVVSNTGGMLLVM